MKVNVLDAKAATFHEAKASAVHEAGHEGVRFVRGEGIDGSEKVGDFLSRENNGQAEGAVGTGGIETGEVDFEDITVEKEKGGKRLVLGAGRDVTLDGEVGEKLFNRRGAEGIGVAEAIG